MDGRRIGTLEERRWRMSGDKERERERGGIGGGKGVGSLAGRGWSRKVGPLSQSLSLDDGRTHKTPF